jgi:hypothetical protein
MLSGSSAARVIETDRLFVVSVLGKLEYSQDVVAP